MTVSGATNPGWRIVIGSDDAGFTYKESLRAFLEGDPRVAEVVDIGVGADEHTFYPHIAAEAGRRIIAGEVDRGLLICGTGLGVAIGANKVKGIRAATTHDSYSVERAVKSNNAQIITLGERVIGLALARKLVDEWLDYTFDPSSPSAEKVDAISAYEAG